MSNVQRVAMLVAFVVVGGLAWRLLTGSFAVQAGESNRKAHRTVQWPPVLDQRYPDLELVDHRGQPVRLSSFTGKVMLVEMIGMTCPACQAFSGAHVQGSFEGVVPQVGLGSFEELLPRYAHGVSLSNDDIVLVQLLLYNMNMGTPTPADAKRWARHFQMDGKDNVFVLAGAEELLGEASYNMIPGFQLIDRSFILRSDSTGHHPRHNLYTELLPMVPKLLGHPSD